MERCTSGIRRSRESWSSGGRALAIAAFGLALLPCGCGDKDSTPQSAPMLLSSAGSYGGQSSAQILPASTTTATDFEVSETTTRQVIDGFGGAFNEKGWDALLVLDQASRDRALQRLFGSSDSARFRFGRIPIGASDYAMDRYTLDDTPGDLAMEHFSIERDQRLLIPYVRAALAQQPALWLWGSAWTPPPWMKTNNAYDSGAMRSDSATLDAYALYLARFVEAYRDAGLAIRAVHVQNEPVEQTRYPSCLWSPELMRDFVRDHMGPVFASRAVPAEIWLGTLDRADMRYPTTVLTDPVARGYIRGIGLQYGALAMAPQLSQTYPDLPIMQTEAYCGNFRTEPNYNPDRPPNDHAYGEATWTRIRSYLQAGARSYMAWNMILDTEGKNLDSSAPWPQNALLVVDRGTRQLVETPAYWAFRHFSAYVDAGARRVDVTGQYQDALAFVNPDGRLVVVLQNSEAQPRALTFRARSSLLTADLPAHAWATIVRP
jgi:glucosylceramidase